MPPIAITLESPAGTSLGDRITAALTTLEADFGESVGWDQPPRLLTLIDHGTHLQAQEIHTANWHPCGGAPADSLALYAYAVHQVGPIMPGVPSFGSGKFAAVAFMFEGWGVEPWNLRASDRRAQRRGQRVLHLHPKRVEFRMASAVSPTGALHHVSRKRGAEPRTIVTGDREAGRPGQGLIPASLRSLALSFGSF